jgi:hypothetical protein
MRPLELAVGGRFGGEVHGIRESVSVSVGAGGRRAGGETQQPPNPPEADANAALAIPAPLG